MTFTLTASPNKHTLSTPNSTLTSTHSSTLTASQNHHSTFRPTAAPTSLRCFRSNPLSFSWGNTCRFGLGFYSPATSTKTVLSKLGWETAATERRDCPRGRHKVSENRNLLGWWKKEFERTYPICWVPNLWTVPNGWICPNYNGYIV